MSSSILGASKMHSTCIQLKREGKLMKLTQDQQDLLDGKFGEGAKLAMKVQVAIGESFGAERMVPITRAHVALSNQDADRWLAEKLAGLGAKCRVRPTVNPGFCLSYFKKMGVVTNKDYEEMERTDRAYRALGAELSYNCTPYMVGGFASVAAANMMHVLFITIGMAVAMFIMAENPAVGGFSALFAKAAAMKTATGADMNMLSMTKIGVPTVIGYIVMYCMTFPTGQEIVQTFCSAKDGKSAKIGSVLTGILSAVYAIVPAMIGLMAYTCIDGYAVSQQKNALADATMQFAPSIIAGIILAAVVAATMSSASGNMIGTATMFTNDVYRPYIRGGVHDDKKEILVSRVVMTIVGLVGLGVALTASNIISVMMSAFALRSAGPFAAFIGGLFCKNVTKDAGFLSILSGTAVAAYWTYALKSPFGLSAMVPGGIVAFAVLFIVSKYQISRGVEAAAPIELDKE